ncbi:MAG: hypothetical protein V3U41_02650 [candidate division NC10 bacterium]
MRRGSPQSEPEARDGEEQYLLVAEKIVGTAMMFIGFLNILLSISGGYEINVVPLLLYCGGLAVWAHATVANQTTRYALIGVAIVVGLAIYDYGEVLFWHKQVIFWGTVGLVVFFMFKSSPK